MNDIPYGTRRYIAEWISYIPKMKDMPDESDWDRATWEEQECPTIEAAMALSLENGLTGDGRAIVQEYTKNNTYLGGDWEDVELWVDGDLIRKYNNDTD